MLHHMLSSLLRLFIKRDFSRFFFSLSEYFKYVLFLFNIYEYIITIRIYKNYYNYIIIY